MIAVCTAAAPRASRANFSKCPKTERFVFKNQNQNENAFYAKNKRKQKK
jgi:hypothetical protein